MVRLTVLLLAATTVVGCALTGGTLGGREKCWPEDPPRIASLMKGVLHVGGPDPTLVTPEGETLPLRLNRFDLAQGDGGAAIADPGGGGVVAVDGETVTLFGGLGGDGTMYVCGVEERSS